MSYLGIPPFGQTVRTVTEITATSGQTTFSPSGGYIPGYIDVYLNGVALYTTDFTASNSVEVVLASAASAGDEFKSITYFPVSLTDTYRKSEVNTLVNNSIGAVGSGTDKIFYLNGQTINSDYTIPSGQNAGTFGNITIATGVTVTVSTGSDWVVV